MKVFSYITVVECLGERAEGSDQATAWRSFGQIHIDNDIGDSATNDQTWAGIVLPYKIVYLILTGSVS
jgi:hypothetical protein